MKMIPFLLCLLVQICTAAAAATCAGGIFASVASLLSGFGPASTYCSAKYPLPLVTATSTAPVSTITSTVATRTISLTVSTATSTITAAPVTTTNTVSTETITKTTGTTTVIQTLIDTVTVTVTVTITDLPNKRTLIPRASTTLKTSTTKATVPNGQPSLWSSLIAVNPPFVGPVCTCLEVPQTTTVTTTPKTTLSVTATSTSSVTTTATATVTPTITVTTTAITTINTIATTSSTTSATTTVTTTTTVQYAPIACTDLPSPYTAPNGKNFDFDCGGYWAVEYETDVIGVKRLPDFKTCLDFCSDYSNLKYVSFNGPVDNCYCLSESYGFAPANDQAGGKVIVGSHA